jgi:hypothetical protein
MAVRRTLNDNPLKLQGDIFCGSEAVLPGVPAMTLVQDVGKNFRK